MRAQGCPPLNRRGGGASGGYPPNGPRIDSAISSQFVGAHITQGGPAQAHPGCNARLCVRARQLHKPFAYGGASRPTDRAALLRARRLRCCLVSRVTGSHWFCPVLGRLDNSTCFADARLDARAAGSPVA